MIGLTTREGAIIERIRTGTPARWASNRPTIQGRNRRSLFPVDGTGGCLMTPQSNKGRAAAGRSLGDLGTKAGALLRRRRTGRNATCNGLPDR